MRNGIRYVWTELAGNRAPIVGTEARKEAIKRRNLWCGKLEDKFGCGDRGLLILHPRRVNCTVLHPWTLRYIADFPIDILDGSEEIELTPARLKKMAARMDRYRRLFMPREDDKQARTVKEAIDLIRARAAH